MKDKIVLNKEIRRLLILKAFYFKLYLKLEV